jgi:hypothetical protein
MFRSLLKTPDDFAPVEQWERYLTEVRNMPPSGLREEAIKLAEATIARLRRREPHRQASRSRG